PGGFSEPMYVIRIEPGDRTVVIGPEPALDSHRVAVGDLNWLGAPPEAGDEVSVQIRHRGAAVGGRIEEIAGNQLAMRLFGAHRAVTPGQSAAIYDGEELLGGGRIR
ncbi:MAG TPA: aminomethyltransferase beta-barrel domain-containing protein, partial [Gemmatimonadota bacterium]|nr:aminomethyltransferase beta-barrel domain-containing protein [Gemmatimonadota bacterium]